MPTAPDVEPVTQEITGSIPVRFAIFHDHLVPGRLHGAILARGGEVVNSPGSYPGDRRFKSALRNH